MAAGTQIIMPHLGFQESFVRTNVDVAFGGSALGAGKTYGEILSIAEESLDQDWRGLFLRNNLDDIKAGGAILDTFREVYGNTIQVRTADMPRVVFPSGAYCDVTHAADQSIEALLRRFKGRQYDTIIFDELTGFSWDAFKTILTRNRGKSRYSGHCRASTNPERECWIREFIDWYIDPDGFIDESRDGVVRYFYMMGGDVKSVVWGDTKEEVYMQCKSDIDRKLDRVYGYMKGRDKWPSMIKSFCFYLGRMSENKEMLANNEGYLGSIAMSGGAEAEKMLMGNWNVSSKDAEDCVLTYDEASSVFTNDEQKNGDGWITVDLADYGTNNFLQIAWDGFHVKDIDIVPFSTPRGNAERVMMFAAKHDIAHPHVIFDATSGMYLKDYIPEAIPYVSGYASMGLNALQYARLKDCCYGKLVSMVKHNLISVSTDVGRRKYVNAAAKTSSQITVQDEFCEEARVIRWVDATNGKKRLMTKREMKKMLGKGRSPDLVDPMAMRMLPVLGVQDGYELENGRVEAQRYSENVRDGNTVDIYDDTSFGISYG